MIECIVAKTHKLNSTNFEAFERNHLLIYDNLPQAAICLEKAISFLTEGLEPLWVAYELQFNRVIIESRNILVEISSIELQMTKMK